MCKFTYLGYGGCEEPERHYFIRREKCVAKAHLKHWCDPHEQEEAVLTEEDELVNMACPMCADIPVLYDQPLLDLAHSRRCVLPAPRYDGVTGQYSGLPRHLVYNNNNNNNNRMMRPHIPPKNSSEALVPRPLNMAHTIHQRSASETAVNRIRQREVAPDYTLPTVRYDEEQEQQQQEMLMLPSATYMPGEEQIPMLPATAYMPPPHDTYSQLPKPLAAPQPMELTPPSSREGSLSPPQNRMGMLMRTIPPGESSRRELESIRERARLASAHNNSNSTGSNNNKQQQQRRTGTDRSRSGSESSTSSFGTPNPPPPPPPPPRRKTSTASSEASAASSRNGGSVASSRSTSRSAVRRPEHHRKESSASAISAASSSSRTPPQPQQQSESGTDRFTTAALRTIGISIDRTDSPDRGRGRQRRERGGSSSERSDSPSVWRPTISPPQLQQDSLGMGSNNNNNNNNNSSSSSSTTNIVEPLKQRLVPFRPTKSGATTPNSVLSTVTTPRRETSVTMLDLQRPPKTPYPNASASSNLRSPAAPLRLYPSKEEDAKIASAAFNTMLQEEHKAMAKATLAYSEQQQQQQQQSQNNNNEDEDLESAIEMHLPTVSMQLTAASSNSDPYGSAGVGRGVAAAAGTAPSSSSKAGGLPAAARAGLRRIKTGQVKTVTIASPLRPLKRSQTEDVLTTPVSATMKVRGGPLFSIAGVAGGRAQEFEIVHKHGEQDESLGKVF